MLLKCGSHLTGSTRSLGESICGAAARGLVKRLESYRIAGADLSLQDPSGRTALHLASLHGHLHIIEYLLQHDVEFMVDMLDLTPMDYARKGNNAQILKLLESKAPNFNNHSD